MSLVGEVRLPISPLDLHSPVQLWSLIATGGRDEQPHQVPGGVRLIPSVFLASQINSLLKVEVIPIDKKESFWAGVGMAGNIQTHKRGLALSEVMWPGFLEAVAVDWPSQDLPFLRLPSQAPPHFSTCSAVKGFLLSGTDRPVALLWRLWLSFMSVLPRSLKKQLTRSQGQSRVWLPGCPPAHEPVSTFLRRVREHSLG